MTTLIFLSGFSVATTLGVSVVAAETLKLAQEHPTLSVVVTDQEAVAAVEKFVGMLLAHSTYLVSLSVTVSTSISTLI